MFEENSFIPKVPNRPFRGKNLVGERYTRLLVVSFNGFQRDKWNLMQREAHWECICDCGTKTTVSGRNLKSGNSKSCGCLKREISTEHCRKHGKEMSSKAIRKKLDETTWTGDSKIGKIFGRLTVLALYEIKRDENGHRSDYWKCQCECGKTLNVRGGSLHHRTNSCGCLRREKTRAMFASHRMSGTKIYTVWAAMKQRCNNPKNKNYPDYGGRGITICNEWEDFEGFAKDMISGYAPGLTLDRKNNNKGYYKDNCRWVTRKVQMQNTRRSYAYSL